MWSIHPRYLDRQGLVACWRESLLAQKALAGLTRGYTRHPQLDRFRAAETPALAIGAYLAGLADEADARGYRFDRSRIAAPPLTVGGPTPELTVTSGQLVYEWGHLMAKLRVRSPETAERWAPRLSPGAIPSAHPLFRRIEGDVAPWERPSS